MKLKNYIKLGFKYFIKNKKKSFNSIIIIIIALTLLNIICGMIIGIKNSLNKSIEENNNLKFISVESKNDKILNYDVINEFNKIDNVTIAFERIQTQVGLRNDKYKYVTTLLGVPDKALKYFDSNLEKYNSENSIIINNSIEDIDTIPINSNLILNYTIRIDQNEGIQGEKAINISNKYTLNSILDLPPDTSLAPIDLVYDIKSNLYNISKEEMYENNNIDKVIVVVDNVDKLNSVSRKIEDMGYITNYSMKSAQELPQFSKFIIGISSIIIIILLIFSCINIHSTIQQTLNQRKKEIGIMKALGFTGKHILNILLFEMIYLICLTFVISLIISALIIFNINSNFSNASIGISSINFNYIQIIIDIIIVSVVVILSTLKTIIKFSNLNPIDIIRGE